MKDLKPVFCSAGKHAVPGIKATSDHKFDSLFFLHVVFPTVAGDETDARKWIADMLVHKHVTISQH